MSLSNVKNIVVVVMENRSFDHMLGSLNLRGHACDGLAPGMSNPGPAGTTHTVRRLGGTYFPCDPDHSWAGVAQQMAGGNAGFVSNFVAAAKPIGPALQDPGLVMGYYDGAQLATYEYLALNFAICDRYFCSLPGPTWPNRLYGVAGTSAGEKDNPDPIFFRRYSMPTIFDYVDAALADRAASSRWGYFHAGPFAFPLVFNQHLDDILPGQRRIRPMGDFFRLASAGTLPVLTWIEPDYRSATKNSDHPEGDVLFGQEFVARVYNALLHGGKQLWSKTLLVVTYDEHGGFFDHVVPTSVAAPPDEYLPHYGLRVPTLVVSPWVAKGAVHSAVLDHASILKTILKTVYGDRPLPAMTRRVHAALDLEPLLTEAHPRTDAVGIPVTPVPRPAAAGVARTRKLTEGHDAAFRHVARATRPQDIDVAIRDRVRVGRSEYQALAEAYSADLRAKGVPVPPDNAPEMGAASAATRLTHGAGIAVRARRRPRGGRARGGVGPGGRWDRAQGRLPGSGGSRPDRAGGIGRASSRR